MHAETVRKDFNMVEQNLFQKVNSCQLVDLESKLMQEMQEILKNCKVNFASKEETTRKLGQLSRKFKDVTELLDKHDDK